MTLLTLHSMPKNDKIFTVVFEGDEGYRAIYVPQVLKPKSSLRDGIMVWLQDDKQTPLSKIDKPFLGIKLEVSK